jgi:hypothetical protein
MKRPSYLMAAIVVATGVAAVQVTPVSATLPSVNLTGHQDPSMTYVHCRRIYHCMWTTRGNTRVRRCHVCP